MDKLDAAGDTPLILHDDPFVEFEKWHELAAASGSLDFDSMVLATVDRKGRPHARVVLYKGTQGGAVKFYTNYKSAKARELAAQPRAALVFFWSAIYRQVRIEGAVKKMSRAESERYFASRPRDSQLGAWASNQSSKVESLAELDSAFEKLEKKFAGKEIPCPPHWGGFLLVPDRVEFWFGRTRRLHYRTLYEKKNPAGKSRFSRLERRAQSEFPPSLVQK